MRAGSGSKAGGTSGDVIVNAGDNEGQAGAGGVLSLAAGGGASSGGEVSIAAGASGSGTGGALSFVAGDGATGGEIVIKSGDGKVGSSGAVSLSTGGTVVGDRWVRIFWFPCEHGRTLTLCRITQRDAFSGYW